VHFVGLFLSSV